MNSAGETTATALAKMRRWAKEQARTTGVSYSAALEQAAKNAGFASWHDARTARRHQAPPEVPFELAVDPVLPQNFDQTANESRSKTELEAWWLRPFALTLPGGGYEVRCLDGGAWDRSTWYGHADTLDAARELARRKLQWWLEVRDTPILHLGEAACLLTLEPNRPGLPRPVLHTASTSEQAAVFLKRWKRIREEEPTVAALTVQAVRERSARVPDVDDVEALITRAQAAGVTDAAGQPPAFDDLALFLTVFRLREPTARSVTFTLAELAHYMWQLGTQSEDEAGAQLQRVLGLLQSGNKVIADSQAESRDGIVWWTLRFNSAPWATSTRRLRARP